jgi:hypothetical protein
MSLNGGIHQTICQSCSTPVKFEINHEIEPLIKRKTHLSRSVSLPNVSL